MKPWYDRLHEKFVTSSIKKNETAEDIKRWQNYISSFDEPKNAIDASYIRHKCRMYHFSLLKRTILNLLGFGALFVELFYILTAREHNSDYQPGKAIIERARDIPDFSDIVPNEMFDNYREVQVIDNINTKFGPLCKTARNMLVKCYCAHPFSFFFIYFVYMELVTHSEILMKYNPECTFVYINERNVATPVLRELYEIENRHFCSFMHGEYTLQLIMAFMSFSEYYVWDKSYISMFEKDLRCDIRKYIIYTPGKLKKKWNLEQTAPTYFCTYYFSGESDDFVLNVANVLLQFDNIGKKCCVRPHPRNLLHRKILEESFKDTNIVIENALDFPLKESLARTQFIVGLQTTVLSEACVEGKQIVIDDISDKDQFQILKMQHFNVFNKPHMLFSDLVNQVCAES